MTIASTARKAGPFPGNGSVTAFPFAFKVFAVDDVLVSVADDAGVETVLVLGTDYTVSLNANQETSPGGTVTYPVSGSPLPNGSLLSIIGDIDYDQPLDLPSGGNYSPLALENQLDRIAMQVQQLKEITSRTLQLSVNSPADTSTALPPPQANAIIAWNATTNGLQNLDPVTLATVVAFGTAVPDIFTGDDVQTAFTLSANPGALGNLDVAVGGVTQLPGVDYFWTSGTSLTFAEAPADGVPILVRYIQALPQGTTDSAASTFTPEGAGAVARTVQSKLRDHVSVRDFGAVGDGVTDDTVAIQVAINASRNVYFPTPSAYYRITKPLVVGRFRRLYGDIGEYYQVSGAPAYQRIGTVIRKEGTDPVNPSGAYLGNGGGYTQDLNVNCVVLLHETGWPYRAEGVVIENLGLDGDASVPVASRATGIVAFRAVKSVLKNLNITNVLNGIQGNTIDYTGIGKTNEGTGNNLDAYLNKVENVKVESINISFDSAGTSWEYDRCYSLGSIVGYRTAGNYSTLLNCACDSATDVAYWNLGVTKYVGCGQEGTNRNQLRDDGTAWVDGWQVTNSAGVVRGTTYNTAFHSATRSLLATDAAYNAVFSSFTVYENADLSFSKATINDGTQLGYKGAPSSFRNVRHRPDGILNYPMTNHSGLGAQTITLPLHAVGSGFPDPITRAVNYASGSFTQVGSINLVDMGAFWLVAGYANLSGLGGDTSPVRLCIESGASRYASGNNSRYEFKPWSVLGTPNYGILPALGAFADAGAGRRGGNFRTLDFVRAVTGGWNWSRVGGYDPTDGLIYMFNASTGAQMKYNDAGVADQWTFTGWLPKAFPAIPTA